MSTTQGYASSATAGEWKRIKQWLEANYRQHLPLLNHPVEQKILAQTEQELGYPLPGALVDVMLINNGEAADSDGLFGTWRLLSVSEQVAAYRFLSGDERFPEKKFHPVLESGGGDFYCIDLSSNALVEWWHEGGYNGAVSPGLAEFLQAFNQSLLDGDYVIVEGLSGLADKSEL